MKPSIMMTVKDRSKLMSLEDSMQSKIEEGQILNMDLLKLVSKHLSICHPEAMISDRGDIPGEIEPKPRGRKTRK